MRPIPRAGEQGVTMPVRGERFFKLNHFWFFATREGAAVGPFDSKSQAIEGVQNFIGFARQASMETMKLFSTRRIFLA